MSEFCLHRVQDEGVSLAYSACSGGGGFEATWADPTPSDCGPVRGKTRGTDCDRQNTVHTSSGAPAWIAAVKATLDAQLQPGDIVAIVTAEWKFPHLLYVEAQRAFLRDAAAQFAMRGAQLLLIADVPYIREKARSCPARFICVLFRPSNLGRYLSCRLCGVTGARVSQL